MHHDEQLVFDTHHMSRLLNNCYEKKNENEDRPTPLPPLRLNNIVFAVQGCNLLFSIPFGKNCITELNPV